MCGIVGVLSTSTPRALSSEDRNRALTAATRLAQSPDQSDEGQWGEWLEILSSWISELPGFETSFQLGTDSTLGKDIQTVLQALRSFSARIDEGKQQAQDFQRLEFWNQLGIRCRDLLWRLEQDLLEVQESLDSFLPKPWYKEDQSLLRAFWEIEFVLRGLNKLEIRGRDSGGLSIQVSFPAKKAWDDFVNRVEKRALSASLRERSERAGSGSGVITGYQEEPSATPVLGFLYKVASEVGSIGQNIQDLRRALRTDGILREALKTPGIFLNVLSHTRWASNGIINVPNTHPQGNDVKGMTAGATRLLAALNGDIDNFSELLDAYRRRTGKELPEGVTTDAKIIPLLVEERYQKVGDLREAFRQCLKEFRGSFAIGIHHADEPDRVLLGIGGSGQSLYVGVHHNTVYYASELYGLVEGTSRFVKLDGEKENEPGNPDSRGQLVEIHRSNIGNERPFEAWSFDGQELTEEHLPLKTAEITTRDINIDNYPHFFLKEITESVQSVHKTLYGRFFVREEGGTPFVFNLDETSVPSSVVEKLNEDKIRHIYCIGQGTAAVAAMSVAESLQLHLRKGIDIRSTKATELSGHMLRENMEDTLIIAVSQSGTTTDTNRTVDLVRQRGAQVLAILNRRNSDLAFKADGVIFTSDGRDIEMSVASTKAFYSQVTAGALLALYLAWRTHQMSASAVHNGLKELLALPGKMEQVLAQNREIAKVAREYALKKRYWAVVGSGTNQIAAQEIRIKLSELCYKSMSCDYIEDKKHIDLSAEPLMLVCASGLNEANLSDSVKEVAIFKAHSSIPIVVASRGADRFRPYAAAVFEVPDVPEHLSPVMNTIVGHLFGYHAACAIDEQAVALRRVRQTLIEVVPALETSSRLALGGNSYSELRQQLLNLLNTLQTENFNSSLEVQTATKLALTGQKLLLELAGLVGQDETESPYEVAQRFQHVLTTAINELSRPIDAIKHQAKTVTVGISRPTPTLKGALGRVLEELQIDPTLILWRNLSYLMAADPLIAKVSGAVQYNVSGLDSNNQPSERTKILKESAHGAASALRSRTEEDPTLRGSKWFVLRNNEVQIGVGQQDGRHIAIIPLRGTKPREARILLLHIEYNEAATLEQRLQLLRNRGQVYDRLKAAVTEVNRTWSDDLLLQVPVSTLFDDSTEHFLVSLPALS